MSLLRFQSPLVHPNLCRKPFVKFRGRNKNKKNNNGEENNLMKNKFFITIEKNLLMQNFLMVYTLFLYSPRGAYFIFLVTFPDSNIWDNKMFTYLGNKFYILLYWGWGGQLSKIFSLKECLVFVYPAGPWCNWCLVTEYIMTGVCYYPFLVTQILTPSPCQFL